jgi:II/X family phage/plasmid replication protein
MTVHQLDQVAARQLIDAGRLRLGLPPVDDEQPSVRRPVSQVEARAVLQLVREQQGLEALSEGELRAAIAEAQWSAAGPGGPSVASPAGPALGRDDLVTRPVCPNSWTAEQATPFFVDWLTIAQDWPEGGLPKVDAGAVWRADAQGEIKWKTIAAAEHVGSFDTHLLIRSDGFSVKLSGNLSRFGRADNVFGYDFFECVARANVVLAAYGLPAFTAGRRIELVSKGRIRTAWTGARVSRIDLTANWMAGSEDNAHAVMQWLGTQHNGRKAGRTLGSGETVDWGAGSKRQYWKAYIKHIDLIKARKKGGLVDDRVLDWCRQNGLVRFEGTIRSNALTDIGAAYLGDYESGWAMGQLIQLFQEHSAVMHRAENATDDLSELPRALRATARDYLAGQDMSKALGRSTFYSHRRKLLAYGIDIAIRNVRPFQPRVRVVELAPAVAPSWYQLAA